MRFERKRKPRHWAPHFALLPILIGEQWIWLERIERRWAPQVSQNIEGRWEYRA